MAVRGPNASFCYFCLDFAFNVDNQEPHYHKLPIARATVFLITLYYNTSACVWKFNCARFANCKANASAEKENCAK